MEKSLLEMIENYKKGNKQIFLEIVDKMKPLLNGYVKRLYTWERQDAAQEMVVALLNGIEKIKYLRNEGECIKYACACVRNAYIRIVKSEIKNKIEFADMDQIMDAKDTMGMVEIKMDLMPYLRTLHGKARRISELILISGKSDSEIAEMMQVSRQYINRIKNELKNKLIS